MLINTKNEIDSRVSQILEDAKITTPIDTTLAEKLKANKLSTEECVEQLADIARNGDSRDAIRLRAIEMGFKLNGDLKEAERPTAPAFTIVINDPGSQYSGINPILIPRVNVSKSSNDKTN